MTMVLFALPTWAQRICTGDCGSDGSVTIEEIVVGTNIALGEGELLDCTAFDRDGGQSVEVDELVAGVTHALAGCPLQTMADAAFWQTLRGERDRAGEALELFRQAIEVDATDARSHFLLGMTHFYRFGRGLSGYDDFDDTAKEEIVLTNTSLELAVVHAPENRAYPGFLGAATYMNGIVHGDQSLVDLGLERLRASIELWPLFNRFSFLGTVAAVAPAGSPLFDEAFDYLRDALSPEGLFECTARLCGDAGLAPRNLAGSALLFGDIFAKGGDVAQARSWYQFSAGFGGSDWVFTSLSSDRADNVQARIALYQDGDRSNDPAIAGLGVENCAICHYR